MKTKVLYVLISCEKDYYTEQMMISLCSLRMHNPDVCVVLLTDEETSNYLKEMSNDILRNFNEKVIIKFPKEISNKARSRELKTNARNYINGDYLFLDTDTIVLGKIDDIDSLDVDMGGVYDMHQPSLSNIRYLNSIKRWAQKIGWNTIDLSKPYYNSGVLYVKDNQKTREFYRLWNSSWKKSFQKGVFQDQPTLNILNNDKQIISKIDDKWHCQILGNGLRFLDRAIVIHYYNGSFMKQNTIQPFCFMNNEIFAQIREKGMYDELKELLAHAKEGFPSQVDIISGNSIPVYYSSVFRMFLLIYGRAPRLFSIIDSLAESVRKMWTLFVENK